MKLYRKDIAKIAGVSAQTVSYVLNGSRNFSEETVEKVMKVVRETGYKPDAIANGRIRFIQPFAGRRIREGVRQKILRRFGVLDRK